MQGWWKNNRKSEIFREVEVGSYIVRKILNVTLRVWQKVSVLIDKYLWENRHIYSMCSRLIDMTCRFLKFKRINYFNIYITNIAEYHTCFSQSNNLYHSVCHILLSKQHDPTTFLSIFYRRRYLFWDKKNKKQSSKIKM